MYHISYLIIETIPIVNFTLNLNLSKKFINPTPILPVNQVQTLNIHVPHLITVATNSCSVFLRSLEDNVLPVVANCPEDIVQIVPLNSGFVPVSWTPPTATDNTGAVTLVSNSHSPNDNFPVGSTEVIYTYSDGSNQARCSFSVIVLEGRLIWLSLVF